MRNGHNLQMYVMPILKALGYEEKDIVLEGNFGFIEYPKPDYIIKDNDTLIAVELGGLSDKNKIRDLLEKYDKVIWITSNDEMPLMNCVIYDKNDLAIDVEARKYKQELELKKKELDRSDSRNIANYRKLIAIKDIIDTADINLSGQYYDYEIKKSIKNINDKNLFSQDF